MTTEERCQLVVDFMPFAEKLARQKSQNTPKFIEFDELRSAAYYGLIKAVDKFNPELDVSFSTYAYIRIVGAMKDWLRQLSWGGRTNFVKLASLDDENENGECLADMIPDEEEIYSPDFFDVVTRNMDDMSKRIVIMYYIRDLTLKQIGAELGVSESRVCQIMSQVRTHIKNRWSQSELYEMAA
jgi:RNA polymerase sigma factor for flagellar operon FliA